MDVRALRELELLPVARLYGIVAAPAATAPARVRLAWGECRAWSNRVAICIAAEEGDPFDAAQGKLLQSMLAAIGWQGLAPAEAADDDAGVKMILALGDAAAARFAAARGKVQRHGDTPVIASFHPAHLLRSAADKARAWEDLLLARRTLAAMQ